MAELITVTDDSFDEQVIQSDKPVLVDFWAVWCVPCKAVTPIMAELAAEYDGRVVVAKLDVDHNPVTPGRFGIMGIPTVLFIKDGKEVDRIVGVQGYTAFANRIEKYIETEPA